MWQFYLLCFSVIIFGLFYRKKQSKNFVYLFFLLILLLQALRASTIGNDTETYIYIFNAVRDGFTYGRIEKGFLFIVKLCATIFDNSQAFIAVTSIFIMIGYMLFVAKRTKLSWLSVFLFISAGLMRFSFSAIRQNMAIIIFLYSLRFIKRKRIVPYTICIILAATLHQSAILLLLVYFVDRIEIKRFVRLGIPIAIGSTIVFPEVIRLVVGLLPAYARYMTSIYATGVTLAAVMQLLISISEFFLCYYLYLINSNKRTETLVDNSFFLKMVFIKMSLLLISLRLNNIDRMAEYFSVFEIVLVPNLIMTINSRKNRSLYIATVVVCFLAYVTIWYYGHPETQTVWPYRAYFMN